MCSLNPRIALHHRDNTGVLPDDGMVADSVHVLDLLERSARARRRPVEWPSLSYLSPEQRVPADHPLRAIRAMTDEALRRLSPQFETLRTYHSVAMTATMNNATNRRSSARIGMEPPRLRTVPHPIEPYKPSFRPTVPSSTGAGVVKLFAPSGGRR
jgi:hypothetical protein